MKMCSVGNVVYILGAATMYIVQYGVHAFSKAHPTPVTTKKYVRFYVWTKINSQVSHDEWLFAKDYFDQNLHTHTSLYRHTRRIVLFYIYSEYVLEHTHGGGNEMARARSLHVPFRKREKRVHEMWDSPRCLIRFDASLWLFPSLFTKYRSKL